MKILHPKHSDEHHSLADFNASYIKAEVRPLLQRIISDLVLSDPKAPALPAASRMLRALDDLIDDMRFS